LSIGLLVVASACSRDKNDKSDKMDAAVSSVMSISSAMPKETDAARTTTSPFEARRTRPKKLDEDRALASSADVLRAHFGAKLPERLAVQSADLVSPRRRAILAVDESKTPAESAPIVLVANDDGSPLWVKERPAAGILAPIGPLAIAPGPRGRVALAVCDPPTSAVAVRLWDEDGSPFADFSVMDTEGCDAISFLYWPKVGWLVVVVRPGATRAQLLRESGALAWGRGVEIGTRAMKPTGASLAFDGEDKFFLVERAPVDGPRDHVFAYLFDARAVAQWPSAVDLGETKLAIGERILLARGGMHLVRAVLGPGDAVDIPPRGYERPIDAVKSP
jgi:hypothetical protein